MPNNRRGHRKLRIGMMVTSVEFGGLEKVVIQIIENIDKYTFDIVPLIFIAKRNKTNAFESYLQESGKAYSPIIVDNCRFKYTNPIINLQKVYRIFKDQKFDIIHTHGYRADVIGYIAARALNLPIISTCHGFIPNDRKLKIYNEIDKYILKKFNRVIAVSKGIRDSLVNAGVAENAISVIPNAVSIRRNGGSTSAKLREVNRKKMGWNDDHFVCGYIGRLSEEKGIEYLLSALSNLSRIGIPVRLVVIGDGEQRNKLEQMSKELEINGYISFMGFRDDVQDWLPVLDVFVLPSLMEGTPLAMLEAMLCGLPIVASKVGGIPDVVKSGSNGILVNPGRVQELADAISLLYHDREYGAAIGKEAQATVKAEYHVKQWIRKIEAEYVRLSPG